MDGTKVYKEVIPLIDRMEDKKNMEQTMMWEKHQTQKEEAEGWREMFPILEKLTGKAKEELNSKEWRVFFQAVEKWGYYEHLRRMALEDHEAKGVFWN